MLTPPLVPNSYSDTIVDVLVPYAKRAWALARGDCKDLVIAAIAKSPRYDKPNPDYDVEMTIRKAHRSAPKANCSEPGPRTGP